MLDLRTLLSVLLVGPVLAQTRQFEPDQHRLASTLFGVNYLRTLACGDVDGDGDSDCVVGALGFFGSLEVSLLRGQAGTWQRSLLFSLPASPPMQVLATSLADLDGDLDLDLLITSASIPGTSSSPMVRFDYFRNDGGGVFTAVRTTQVPGTTSTALALGDVDGDGDLDLVIAFTDAAGAPLPLVLARNDGTFAFQVVANALPPIAVVTPLLADLDGDGDLDVVAADATDQLRVFVNQNGAFAAGAVLPGRAVHIAAADFDRDGDVDLFVQRRDGAIDLLRNVQGTFVAQAIAAGGQGAGGPPVLADVDGDLDVDVVVQHGGSVRLWRNDGSAHFTGEPLPGVSGVIAGGDVDGDGRTDVVFGSNELGGVAAAYGRSGPLLIDPALARARYAPFGGQTKDTGDIDGDGRIDVLQVDFDRLLVRANAGAGEWATVIVPVPLYRPDARIVDVDGDGDGDLVAVNGDAAGGLQVVRNDGGFTFTPLPLQPLPSAWIAGVADLDNDGDQDLLVVIGSALTLVRNLGGGSFAAPVPVGASIGGSSAGVTDFDHDGDLDLLVSTGVGSCVQLLTNDGTGNFTMANPCVLSTSPFYLFGIKYVDLDGDGDLDAFAYGYGSGRLYLNQGGTFTPAGTINGVFSGFLLQPWFADWDDDGDLDLLQLGGPAQLWLNNGNGTFVDVSSVRLRPGADFSASAVADLDGDGDVDVISALSGFGSPQAPLNHLRSLSSLSRPVSGGILQLRLANQPGLLGAPAAALAILSLQPRASALAVPGIAGKLQIDAATAVALPGLVLPAPMGTGEIQVNVPPQPALVGFELWAQGLLLGTRPAFTPACHERVLGP